ncbi:MAG: hypothetical protein ABIA78_03565 [archaeon]
MKKRLILTIIIILILATIFLLYSIFLTKNATGAVIENNKYSYTKAICNESKYCQDYEIVCDGNLTIKITPLTGAAIQQLPNWKDPRDKETIEKICG